LIGLKYFGLNGLDQLIEPYIHSGSGYFVEIGANDGFTASNTKHFELFHDWVGILIEPIPEQARLCRTHRKNKTQVFEAACVSFEYVGDSLELLYSDTMTIALAGDSNISDRAQHAESGINFLPQGKSTYKFTAVAKTMTSILDEAKAPNIMQLLSLDVEGGELEVLRGIDHKKYCFEFVILESRDVNRISEYLNGHNYELVKRFGDHDYLYRSVKNPH
jgi:FkbM family methyltransferase